MNDADLARDRACALRARGHGSLRIAAELEARGVAAALVEQAVDESRAGEPEIVWARRALRDERERARAWRHLLARGFPEEIASELLGEPG